MRARVSQSWRNNELIAVIVVVIEVAAQALTITAADCNILLRKSTPDQG
jgi:hypothetical protein